MFCGGRPVNSARGFASATHRELGCVAVEVDAGLGGAGLGGEGFGVAGSGDGAVAIAGLDEAVQVGQGVRFDQVHQRLFDVEEQLERGLELGVPHRHELEEVGGADVTSAGGLVAEQRAELVGVDAVVVEDFFAGLQVA